MAPSRVWWEDDKKRSEGRRGEREMYGSLSCVLGRLQEEERGKCMLLVVCGEKTIRRGARGEEERGRCMAPCRVCWEDYKKRSESEGNVCFLSCVLGRLQEEERRRCMLLVVCVGKTTRREARKMYAPCRMC